MNISEEDKKNILGMSEKRLGLYVVAMNMRKDIVDREYSKVSKLHSEARHAIMSAEQKSLELRKEENRLMTLTWEVADIYSFAKARFDQLKKQ